jgi:hypothetical protein
LKVSDPTTGRRPERAVLDAEPAAGRGLTRRAAERQSLLVCETAVMTSSNFPDWIDRDRLAEAALAILSLTLHDDGRVWKGLDWDLMDLLHEKGWVVDPRTKAKSVVLTEDGERLAAEFLRKYFGRRP